MLRLSNHILRGASGFIREIHEQGSVESLRAAVTNGLRRLVPCERVSFTEYNPRNRNDSFVTAPLPSYWARLGPVFLDLWHQHPLFDPHRAQVPHQVIDFGVRRDDAWRRSGLYHEYYRPIGVRHQLGIWVETQQPCCVALGFNRTGGRFDAEDGAIIELLSPHVACAWRNARRFANLEVTTGGSGTCYAVVDRRKRAGAWFSPGTAALLGRYFGTSPLRACVVPDALWMWLRLQITRHETGGVNHSPPDDYVVVRPEGSLRVSLLRFQPAVTIALCEERAADPAVRLRSPAELTAREAEVLHWIGEGKRNHEIAVITGAGVRTIEKHVEHIFVKLGVETRGAAVRRWCELQKQTDVRIHHE